MFHQLCLAGHEVTVLVKKNPIPGTTFTIVSDRVVKYDVDSNLDDILRGHQAVVCVLPVFYFWERRFFLFSALSAGIKRFVTIEPGSGFEKFVCPSHPVRERVEYRGLEPHLPAVRGRGGMICTLIFTALCLTPGPQDTCLVDIRNRSCRVYDGGDKMLNLTTASKIAQAVTAALRLAPETANRTLRVLSLATTQKRVLRMVASVAGMEDWTWEEWNYRTLLESFPPWASRPGENIISTHEEVSRLVLICNLLMTGEYAFVHDNELLGLGVETEESVAPFVQLYTRHVLRWRGQR